MLKVKTDFKKSLEFLCNPTGAEQPRIPIFCLSALQERPYALLETFDLFCNEENHIPSSAFHPAHFMGIVKLRSLGHTASEDDVFRLD